MMYSSVSRSGAGFTGRNKPTLQLSQKWSNIKEINMKRGKNKENNSYSKVGKCKMWFRSRLTYFIVVKN